MKESSINRRTFLKVTATGVTAACFSPILAINPKAAKAAQYKSRVALALRNRLVNDSDRIESKVVRPTIDELLTALTQAANIRDAWQLIFPNLQSTEVIGIKVNCINRNHSSHPEVAYAVAESLIDSLDINPNKVIIWDRSNSELENARYSINTSQTGIRCFGTMPKVSQFRRVIQSNLDSGIGYNKSLEVDLGNDRKDHFSRILTDLCTYLINLPVLKDHVLSGVSLSMKNHFGSITLPQSCHGGNCEPYISNLNNHPLIKEKTRLVLCDALLGIYHGGPYGPPQWINRQLLASTDPVALDYTGMQLINKRRREDGLRSLEKATIYLRSAARLGLGTNDPELIDLVNV
jgi:uncharacterized protein (DUF362 family)